MTHAHLSRAFVISACFYARKNQLHFSNALDLFNASSEMLVLTQNGHIKLDAAYLSQFIVLRF